MEALTPYLAHIDKLVQESPKDKGSYVHPALKNLGCVSIVLVREAIAPVIFRNLETEITDIEVNGDVYVRAVPNKFKYPERGRGLQVLRALGIGGRLPQNKTVLQKSQQPSEAFDLNTLIFGDSCNHDNRVLPVKAAVSYSDALSLLPKALCVDETFHNRAAEDGSLFNAEEKKNSDNLFTRHFIKPGTLMVQVLSTRGRQLPFIGLQHLMLCVGLAGAYGGQTSLTGTNIRSHVVGLYADRFERALTSPYQLLTELFQGQGEELLKNPTQVMERLHESLSPIHAASIPPAEAQAWMEGLIDDFNADASELIGAYRGAASKVKELFDGWFSK